MSNSSQKLFGVIVCDSRDGWSGPEEFAKRVEKEFGPENGQLKTYVAEEGQFPTTEDLETFQGFYITGSKYSVNDDRQKIQEWIKQLELFIQRAYTLKKPKVFGTCFGLQAIAKALGGKVGKNPSGRFVCKNEKITLCEDEIDSKFLNGLKKISEKKPFRMLEAHGDCVEELPADAKSVASSESCRHEIVLFSDNIIGAQSHADYNVDDFTKIILPSLIITQEEEDRALESFKEPNVGSDVAAVVRDFLNS
jgi:GMP synthase (glutamine-hydrolysing)